MHLSESEWIEILTMMHHDVILSAKDNTHFSVGEFSRVLNIEES